MPSSSMLQAVINRQFVGVSFQAPQSYRPDDVLIGPISQQAIGQDLVYLSTVNFVVSAYPSANRVHAYPLCLAEPFLVRKVWWLNGTTVGTNNADVAVYNEAGTVLHVAAGSTLIAGASLIQEVDVTDTLLAPGRYWVAYAQNGTTATPYMMAPANLLSRVAGVAIMAGAVPLGATFTPAAVSTDMAIPMCGIAGRTQVA